MRLLTLLLAAFLALTALVGAQDTPKRVVLGVPLRIADKNEPLTSAQAQQTLEEQIEQSSPDFDVVWIDPSDSRAAGFNLNNDLTPFQAQQLGQAYKTDFVLWGSLDFEGKSTNVPQTFGSQVYVTEMQMTGSSEVHLVSVSTGNFILDRTYPIFSTRRTSAIEGSDAFIAQQADLAREFLQSMARDIVRNLKAKASQPPQPD